MKTTTTHTPAPWRIDSHSGKILGPSLGSSSPVVAQMPVWWPNQTPGKHLSQDLQSANAALIASAPDLLEACKAALEFWDKPRPTFGCNEQRKADLEHAQALIRNAIAKASTQRST